MAQGVRMTPTTTGVRKKGLAKYGLEGNLFLAPVVCILVGIVAGTVSFAITASLVLAILLGITPIALCVVWLMLFKIDKPPHYDVDWFQSVTGGNHLSFHQPSQRRHRNPDAQ